MKLKKSGFVNIIEKPHKLSQKFSLATVKSRKPEYIYHENSNFLLFPKSKRHIEILGDEFKIDKKKYNLEYINISPFSGGSGRYREFFYKKI